MKSLALVATLFLLAARSGNARASDPVPSASHSWLPSAASPPKGVAVLAHGLNLKPEKMDSIGKTLTEDGIEVLRVSLSGHRGSMEEFKQVDRLRWVREIHAAYCEARKRSDASGIPLYFVGYSTSAVLGLDLMNSFPDAQVRFDRMILFAPPLALAWSSELVRVFRILGDGFVLPSANDPGYRANLSGTPMAGYGAMLDSLTALRKARIRQADTPTLVVIDPEDLLVSVRGLRRLISEWGLHAWKLFEVTTVEGKATNFNHHLVIDEAGLGAWAWEQVRLAMRAHLKGEAIHANASRAQLCARDGAWKTLSSAYCERDSAAGCDRRTFPCLPLPKRK